MFYFCDLHDLCFSALQFLLNSVLTCQIANIWLFCCMNVTGYILSIVFSLMATHEMVPLYRAAKSCLVTEMVVISKMHLKTGK